MKGTKERRAKRRSGLWQGEGAWRVFPTGRWPAPPRVGEISGAAVVRRKVEDGDEGKVREWRGRMQREWGKGTEKKEGG